MRRGWPLLLLAVATGMAAAIFLRWPDGQVPKAGPGADRDPLNLAAAAAGPAVTPATRVVYRTTFQPCGTTEEAAGPPAPSLIGMRPEDIERLYSQWTVVAFSPEEVVLARETDELCTEYREWRHVRLVEGVVVVYYGRSGSELVQERTRITAAMLPAQERLRLYRGIDLPGDEAVRAFLERGH